MAKNNIRGCTLDPSENWASGLRLKITKIDPEDTRYFLLVIHIESGSSAVSVINVSMKMLPESSGISFNYILFKESNVPNAQVDISPSLGAFGLT